MRGLLLCERKAFVSPKSWKFCHGVTEVTEKGKEKLVVFASSVLSVSPWQKVVLFEVLAHAGFF